VTSKPARIRRLLAILSDPRTPKLPRLALLAAFVYLVMPIDVVPDFMVPVAGFIDDAALLWLSLGWLFKSAPRAEVVPPETTGPPRSDRITP
jgi:uncharacterized membrane protein YkvA (DUF1232 family)